MIDRFDRPIRRADVTDVATSCRGDKTRRDSCWPRSTWITGLGPDPWIPPLDFCMRTAMSRPIASHPRRPGTPSFTTAMSRLIATYPPRPAPQLHHPNLVVRRTASGRDLLHARVPLGRECYSIATMHLSLLRPDHHRNTSTVSRSNRPRH